MSKTPERVLGDAAVGDLDKPDAKGSTIQPGLVETDERAGKTIQEQAAADAKAAAKTEKKES